MNINETLRQAEMQRDRYKQALKALPVVLSQLDSDGADFLAEILQASIEAGYNDGFADGRGGQQKGDRLYETKDMCEYCDGTGVVDGGVDGAECPNCGGSGQVSV